MWEAIRREVMGSLEPPVAWIADETGWLKQGKHSVGVAHQCCGAVGKSANCQVNVQVAVTDGKEATGVLLAVTPDGTNNLTSAVPVTGLCVVARRIPTARRV